MKEIINNNKQIFDTLNNKKSKDRATEVFNKLLAKQKKVKNPFDEVKTYTTPSLSEIKPGADDV